MIWIILLICFCNLTNGNEDNTRSLPTKDNSKFGNTIARRILEEIKGRDVHKIKGSEQQVDNLGKERNGLPNFVTSAIKEQASGNNEYSSTTENAYDIKAINENEEMQQDNRTNFNMKPLKSALYLSVLPVNVATDKKLNKNSTILSEADENNMKNINDHSDIMKTEADSVSHANNLNESIESDEYKRTSRIAEEEEGITIPESDVNVTVIPPLVTRVYVRYTKKTNLRFLKNNKKAPESSSYLAPNLSHLKKVKSKSKNKEVNSLTKFPSSINGKLNKNNNLDSKHNILFPNGYYIKTKKNKFTFSDANITENNSETDTVAIPEQKNHSMKYKVQKPSQNYSKNRIDLTFIQNLNVNSHNTNSYNDHGKFGQNKNKPNNYYEAHNSVNEKQLTAPYESENSDESEMNFLLSEIRPLLSTRSNVATEKPIYDVYIPQTDYRHSENSKRLKDDVTPISVDYYFDRNNNKEESDYSDEVIDPVEERHESDPVTINFDQNADAIGRSHNEVMLNVLRDMIKMNSKPFVDYPWLKSVLEVRSGILKIIDLIEAYVYNYKIHPLDLELLKYLLYLYKSSNMKLRISENSPYSRPQHNILGMNTKQVPILTNLFKNVKKDGHKRLSGYGPTVEDQQLTILFGLQDFFNEVLFQLDSFHRKIQELANHPHINLNNKLKDEYLKHAEDHHLRVVLLHISLARLFENIDNSATRVREGFYNYVQQHPEEVKRDKEESVFILNVLEQLRWK